MDSRRSSIRADAATGVDRMLEIARLTSEDVIYDLGSGDGAIIIQAAKKFGVRGVGIEIDADRVHKAQANAFQRKSPRSRRVSCAGCVDS